MYCKICCKTSAVISTSSLLGVSTSCISPSATLISPMSDIIAVIAAVGSGEENSSGSSSPSMNPSSSSSWYSSSSYSSTSSSATSLSSTPSSNSASSSSPYISSSASPSTGPSSASAISGVITAPTLCGRTVTRTRASLLPMPKAPRAGSCKTAISTSSRRFFKRAKPCNTASSTLLPLASILSTVCCLPLFQYQARTASERQLTA